MKEVENRAKTNDLPGVYFNVMIFSQFCLKIQRHTEKHVLNFNEFLTPNYAL